VKWGVLGAAKIGLKKVIPAMQRTELCDIRAIASRDAAKAQKAAEQVGIPVSYGSYEELLRDEEIEAVYIPLPNHLHVEWTRKALEAGKHVLCEKPLALKTQEVEELIELRDRTGLKVGEAFMVDTHPQWIETRARVRRGELGTLKAAQGFFSYNNPDPENIRNKYREGGGGLWDIGCYPVHTARYIFEEEPTEALAVIERDQEVGVDILTSGILSFPSGTLTFGSSTRLVANQYMTFFGDRASLTVDVPFNQMPDDPPILYLDRASSFPPEPERIELEKVDQYGLQGDAFSRAILEEGEVPVPLENTLRNTAAILALFRSAETGRREPVRTD
jgi:predicted dehydrogenase